MSSIPVPRSPEQFFAGSPIGLSLYRRVAEVVHGAGPAEVRVSKSQIAFRNGRGFAYVWRPDRYLKTTVPAVLSIALPRPLSSDRIKSVVHASPSVWMHHIELNDLADVDDAVAGWLREAFENASSAPRRGDGEGTGA